MNSAEWGMAFQDLALLCASSAEWDQEERLREAFMTLTHFTEDQSKYSFHLPNSSDWEALLAVKAYESAAMKLLPQGVSFLCSRGETGLALATVSFPHSVDETTAVGNTIALAILQAGLIALISDSESKEKHFAAEDWMPSSAAILH